MTAVFGGASGKSCFAAVTSASGGKGGVMQGRQKPTGSKEEAGRDRRCRGIRTRCGCRGAGPGVRSGMIHTSEAQNCSGRGCR